jgi:hypothetical protein
MPTVAATTAPLAASMFSKACAFLVQAAGNAGAHVLQDEEVDKSVILRV